MKRTYKYTIELDEPMYPRNIADYMTMQPFWSHHLLSVKDLQQKHVSCAYEEDGTVYRTGIDEGKTQERVLYLNGKWVTAKDYDLPF